MVDLLINEAVKYFFHIALVGLVGALTIIWRRVVAVQCGVQMLMMKLLVQEHDKYIEQGYISVLQKAMYKKEHDSYLGLGVNGILDQTYEEVMALPIKEK